MDIIVELVLVAILLLLGNIQPEILVNFAHSTLGKVIMVLLILATAKTRGLTAGLLSALIFIFLLHSYKEGLSSTTEEECATAFNNMDCSLTDRICAKKALTCAKKDEPDENTPRSVTNRVDNENNLNRGAEEATLAASRQANDQTNN